MTRTYGDLLRDKRQAASRNAAERKARVGGAGLCWECGREPAEGGLGPNCKARRHRAELERDQRLARFVGYTA